MREAITTAYVEEHPELLFFDGLDEAIIGVNLCMSGNPRVAYSAHKIMVCLAERGMGYGEAKEFMEFNIESAYLGEYTPAVIDDLF
jgi:hypothetical protein